MSQDSICSAMTQDVVATNLGIASEKFGELAALFDAIAKELPEDDSARKLATLGKFVAQDYEEQAGCWKEWVEGVGIRQGEAA